MPNVTQIIRSVSRQKKVRQDIVEKDYALSYLVSAINATAGVGENLVLKGGTALKKLYFGDYRFSEDLDYSTRVIGPISNIDTYIRTAVLQMGDVLDENGPFQVTYEPLILKQPHPGEQKAYLVRVQFPEQRQPLCRLKVEITIDEPIFTPVERRPLLHGFPENFNAQIPGYSLSEITAEKMRALLQSKERLHEKGWGASRACRDYYDLWNLLRLPETIGPNFIPLLREKCAVRHVSFTSPSDFISEDLIDVAKSEWPQQLLPFVPDAPLAEEVISQVKTLIISVWKENGG